MRRSIYWSVVLLVGAILPGCGDSGSDSAGDPPAAANGLLRQVSSAEELEQSLKGGLADAVAEGIPANLDAVIASAAVTAAPPPGFSGTYTLESDVDELDVVRYDGTHLFVAPAFTGPPGESTAIRILRTDPVAATASEVGTIPLEDSHSVQGMYVADDRLFLITSEVYFGYFGDVWLNSFVWAPSTFNVQVHDIRDPARPRRLMTATIDGVFVASRRIGERVVLVSRHGPRLLVEPGRQRDLQQVSLADLLPKITLNGNRRAFVDPRRCYISNDSEGERKRIGHAVLTSITTFSLRTPLAVDGICYDEPADGVYASNEALYVSEPRFSFPDARTRIHKFTLNGARPAYAGSADLPGTMWGSSQQDFRMNESGGLLRVMTTTFTGDSGDFLDHQLFVLRQKSNEQSLEVVGRLPNETRTEEIGKPNESLFAVRFDGNRAFAVTFLRIDPLYVIDLSSPTDPRIAGQLMIPGVSEFLHPVSENLLLGLGTDAGRVKLELFDTSVLENPQSRGAITLEGTSSYSPAFYDRHAFTYLAAESSDRLALPAVVHTSQPGGSFEMRTSLHQFEILGKQSASSASLQQAGALSPSGQRYASVNRAFIHSEAVYYIRETQVWGAFWSTPSQVNGPF